MVSAKLELDHLTSLLATYHILNAPTSQNQEYNPDIFKRLEVSPEERGHYLTHLLSKGVPLDQTDWELAKASIFSPEHSTLDDYLSSEHGNALPEEVRASLRAFEERFKPYFDEVKTKLQPLIQQRQEEAEGVIDEIYQAAREMTGVEIELPSEIEVRIVEGYAPSAHGSEVVNGKGYVVENTHNFVRQGESYLNTLIHEAVCHQTTKETRTYHNELFGRFVYDLEEGFAKLFTRKIAERIVGRGLEHVHSGGVEGLAYRTFDKNWGSLKGNNFADWYKVCLVEIKEQCSK